MPLVHDAQRPGVAYAGVMTSSRPTGGTLFLSQLFAVAGVVHLVRPQVFEPMVPAPIPAREAVWVSGAAELACAAGLLLPSTRRAAGTASAALLVAVFPANVKMAGDAWRLRRRTSSGSVRVGAAVARLPLQWPLIRLAWRAARGRG